MEPAETFSATGPCVRAEVAVHKLLPLLPAKAVSGSFSSPLCCHRVSDDHHLDALATAAQRGPHATSQALDNVAEVLFHEINSVRLKTVKEGMHADRVSAAAR